VDLDTPEEFNNQLSIVILKWDRQEYSIHPQEEPRFTSGSLNMMQKVIKSCMLSSVRVKAGLKSPPSPYTTNRNESMTK